MRRYRTALGSAVVLAALATAGLAAADEPAPAPKPVQPAPPPKPVQPAPTKAEMKQARKGGAPDAAPSTGPRHEMRKAAVGEREERPAGPGNLNRARHEGDGDGAERGPRLGEASSAPPERMAKKGKGAPGAPGERRADEAKLQKQRSNAMAQIRKARQEMRAAYQAQLSGDPEAEAMLEEAKKKAAKARKKSRKALHAAQMERAKGAKRLSPEEKAELEKKLSERAKKRAEDRKERAEKHREEIKKAHADKLEKPLVKGEFGRHAWRVARLSRILELAETADRPEQAAKARDLLEKENARHEKCLADLAAGKLPGPAADTETAAPAPPQPAPPPPATPPPAAPAPAGGEQ